MSHPCLAWHRARGCLGRPLCTGPSSLAVLLFGPCPVLCTVLAALFIPSMNSRLLWRVLLLLGPCQQATVGGQHSLSDGQGLRPGVALLGALAPSPQVPQPQGGRYSP